MKVVIDYVVGYAGGTCIGSYLLDGCRPPEVGDVIELFVRKGKSPVIVDLVATPIRRDREVYIRVLCSVTALPAVA